MWAVSTRTDWATFYDHRGVGRVIRSNDPYGYFIHRGAEEGTLDRGLLAQAQRAGAKVVFNSRLPADQADIVATGPASPDGLAINSRQLLVPRSSAA